MTRTPNKLCHKHDYSRTSDMCGSPQSCSTVEILTRSGSSSDISIYNRMNRAAMSATWRAIRYFILRIRLVEQQVHQMHMRGTCHTDFRRCYKSIGHCYR